VSTLAKPVSFLEQAFFIWGSRFEIGLKDFWRNLPAGRQVGRRARLRGVWEKSREARLPMR
jgi:hypothetical protein